MEKLIRLYMNNEVVLAAIIRKVEMGCQLNSGCEPTGNQSLHAVKTDK